MSVCEVKVVKLLGTLWHTLLHRVGLHDNYGSGRHGIFLSQRKNACIISIHLRFLLAFGLGGNAKDHFEMFEGDAYNDDGCCVCVGCEEGPRTKVGKDASKAGDVGGGRGEM